MKENLSQRKLLEVLTYEIEVLRKTSANIHEVAPLINEQLNEIKKAKLVAHVDLREVHALLSEHRKFVKSKVTIPTWFLIVFVVILGILALQSIWLYAYAFG